MFTNFCEVQIDAASYQHFRYEWSSMFDRRPRVSDLQQILKQKLSNQELFVKYALFTTNVGNGGNRQLVSNERFALKTKDGKLFYAQAVTNDSNADLIDQLKKDTEQLQKEIEAQIKFREQEAAFRQQQSVNSDDFRKQLKDQMKEEYKQMNKQLNISIMKQSVESSYKLILTQKCNFIEKKQKIDKLYQKYERLYQKAAKEYNKINVNHSEELKDRTIKQLVLLGKTGDGKSTFGNRLCGDTSKFGNKHPFKSTNDPHSVTQEIEKYITKIGCDKVSVVDTPGSFDTDGITADWDHARKLVTFLKGCGGINAFIVICKPPRLDGTFLQMLKNLTIMLGRNFWDYVIFVVTHLKVNCEEMKDEKHDTDDDSSSEDEDYRAPDEWLKEFGYIVRGKFDLRVNQPYCIGVENTNVNSYNAAIEKLMTIMKQEKFECDEIKSPFDEKKRKLQMVFDEIEALLDATDQIRDTMLDIGRVIVEQIAEIRRSERNYRVKFGKLDIFGMTALKEMDFKNVDIIERKVKKRDKAKDINMSMMHAVMNVDDEKGVDRNYIDRNISGASNMNDDMYLEGTFNNTFDSGNLLYFDELENKASEKKQSEIDESKIEKNIIDTTLYLEWTSTQFVDWICRLEQMKYQKYEMRLRQVFSDEAISGETIPYIKMDDWKQWGITNWKDRNVLHEHITNLMKQNDKIADAVPMVNEGDNVTEYIAR